MAFPAPEFLRNVSYYVSTVFLPWYQGLKIFFIQVILIMVIEESAAKKNKTQVRNSLVESLMKRFSRQS